jgi:putative transcriptional regulator
MKNRIKVERAELNITQQQLAERIGVSRQTINAMELGKYVPSTMLALRLSEVFGKTVNEIFSLEDGEVAAATRE